MKLFTKFVVVMLGVFAANVVAQQNLNLLKFDGSDDYVRLNDNTTLDKLNGATEYTFEAWVYYTDFNGYDDPDDGSGKTDEYMYIAQRYSHWAFALMDDGDPSDGVRLSIIFYDKNLRNYSVDNAVPKNQWAHVAVIRSYDGSKYHIKFYVNGEDKTVATDYAGQTLNSDDDPDDNLYIGQRTANHGVFKGFIDEFRLKDEAVDPSTLHSYRHATPYTSDSHTAALFHFNEGAGNHKTRDEASTNDARLGSTTDGDGQEPTWTAWNDASLTNGFLPLGKVTVDGSADEWIGTPSTTVHGTTVSEGEWIYTGKANDERTDYSGTQSSSDNDITEVRFGQDGDNLYILVKMRDITNVDYPHVCLVFTNGSSSQNFIGDDSKKNNTNDGAATPLGSSAQYGRLVDLHATSTGVPVIEMYDGDSWYAPPTDGQNTVVFSTSNDVIEASIDLDDLGLSSSSTTRVSLMTAPNRVGWNNDIDATAWSNEDQTNGVDVMTPGAADGNAWGRDLSDGDVDNSGEIDLGDVPLPVELSSFTANVNGNTVELNWQTATERNNYGFEIQRRKDGNEEWAKIGFVEGAGNSNSPKTYSFTDKVNTNGKYSYRLKQIDLDGSYEYSNVVEINIGVADKFELLPNYPNPFNPTTKIKYAIPTEMHVTLNVYDVLGRKVATLVNKKQNAGNYEVVFNAGNLPSGIYFAKITAGTYSAVRKMMLVK